MHIKDIEVGSDFQDCTGRHYRCTDVGTRTIAAIELTSDLSDAWFVGPPYSVPEIVFDELAIERVFVSVEDAIRASLASAEEESALLIPSEFVFKMTRARLNCLEHEYPRMRLLAVNRTDGTDEIFHPYAVKPSRSGSGWQIQVYLMRAKKFVAMDEDLFIRMAPLTPRLVNS